MQLHWCLLLGKTGGIINGILAALSIISVLTGLIVWWPLTGKFKQALTFKRRAGAVRFNFDLHKTVGFYSTLVLLPVLFSGIYMVLPDRVNVLVKLLSPVDRPNAYSTIPLKIHSSSPQAGQPAISVSEVEAIVQKRSPAGKLWMLNAPKDRQDVYTVMKNDVTEISRFTGYRDFAVDQYSGDILKVYDRGTGSIGDVFLDWQWPLHSGHAFGWTGRILVFLSGLACPVLYVTGVIRWLQKRGLIICERSAPYLRLSNYTRHRIDQEPMKQLIDNLPGSAGIIAPQSNTQIKARRQLWLQVHLYLGLFVGAVLVVISLSGSLIVFAAQLDAWLNADMMHVDAPNSAAQFRPVEEIIASAKTAIPPMASLRTEFHFPSSRAMYSKLPTTSRPHWITTKSS